MPWHLVRLMGRCLQEDKIAVLVGTITDDVRMLEVPKLRVCALRVTETARARILKVRCSALPASWDCPASDTLSLELGPITTCFLGKPCSARLLFGPKACVLHWKWACMSTGRGGLLADWRGKVGPAFQLGLAARACVWMWL